ncbi:MAG: WYL domain-containing protein [Clostridia bacterium]|nr:WYL domain-containing protein [Clostridia bacterium]
MKEVKCIGEARTGAKEFSDINLKNYTQRVFSMYGGEEKRVELEFTNHLLDSAIDRFGKKDVFYSKSDDKHFTVITKVEVSKHFFGWLLGFGKEVKIVSPSDVKEQFTNYLKDVIEMY